MKRITLTAAVLLCISSLSQAQVVSITGGQTNVALDTATLASAANLDLSSVSADVIAPGTIPNSVAFGINSPTAGSLPTTFSYDPADFLGTFSGTIEHTGSVFFNSDTVEVGNFTIGFDAARDGTLDNAGTGFFVESTTGVAAILFDIVNIGTVAPSTASLDIGADLAVSPEFGSFLLTSGLSTSNLEGAVVGTALVQAVVPEPSSNLLMLVSLGAFAHIVRRRRR